MIDVCTEISQSTRDLSAVTAYVFSFQCSSVVSLLSLLIFENTKKQTGGSHFLRWPCSSQHILNSFHVKVEVMKHRD